MIELSNTTFQAEVLNSELPVLVDFWAGWCGPCRMIAPLVERIATAYQGKLKVGKVDVEAGTNEKLTVAFDIRSLPTLLIFKDGEIVSQLVGAVGYPVLEREVRKYIA